MEAEERQLHEGERFLSLACRNAEQSISLLMQLESQTKAKLHEEVNLTITKEKELKRQLKTYRIAAEQVKVGFDKQGDFPKIEKLQCELTKKMELLNLYEKQIDNTREESARFDNSKKKDIEAWLEFKKMCVSFSEEWLKWKDADKSMERLKDDKVSLEKELYSTSSSCNNVNLSNFQKKIPNSGNEAIDDNVQRLPGENNVYDTREFVDKNIRRSESYGAHDMDIYLQSEQNCINLPPQPTPNTRNKQVKLVSSLLSSFAKHTPKEPMSISKDVKMSYFALPKLPDFHSNKGVNEHGKKLELIILAKSVKKIQLTYQNFTQRKLFYSLEHETPGPKGYGRDHTPMVGTIPLWPGP